jgi:hypothetical protein
MMTFLLAAAAAAAQPAMSNDPDMRCMAAYLVAAGNTDGDASVTADDKAGIQSIVMYFFGKIDARLPGADIRGEIMRMVSSPEYAKVLRPDIERCSVEAETRAKYLETFGDEAESAAAKP